MNFFDRTNELLEIKSGGKVTLIAIAITVISAIGVAIHAAIKFF